ncbi:MAG: hypothetical protein K1X92_05090 [Bacteroidia bacterium]|nr:hypothetical protein [Bacteroidia bacterium]
MITLYHHSDCSKSKKIYNLLILSGNQFKAVDYINNPLTEKEIGEILKELQISASEIIRKKEPLFQEQFEGKNFSENEWIAILSQNPVLIERPVVRTPEKTLIVRGHEKEEELHCLLFEKLHKLYLFLKMDETDAFSLYSIAYEYMLLKNSELAIIYFEKLRSIHPDYTGLYFHLGKMYEQAGNPEEGMKIFLEGIKAAEQKKDTHALSELRNLVQNRNMGIMDDD